METLDLNDGTSHNCGSVVDSLPDADDGKRARSALQDDERQGDRAKPKPEGLGLRSAIEEHGRPFKEEAVV